MERVSIFIDGSNLYHSIKVLGNIKIDFEKLIKELSKNRILVNAFYYIAPLDITTNEKKYWKHQKFLAELEKIRQQDASIAKFWTDETGKKEK